jgi:hypothetical protein
VFFWLLLNDRLNTRNLLHRKRFHVQSTSCVLCNLDIEETLMHLFFTCEFAQLCWTSFHIFWDLLLSVVEMIEEGRAHFQHACFMEVVILALWCIWIHRNNLIFNGIQLSLPRWMQEFKELFLLCKHRAKDSLAEDMSAWLSSLYFFCPCKFCTPCTYCILMSSFLIKE